MYLIAEGREGVMHLIAEGREGAMHLIAEGREGAMHLKRKSFFNFKKSNNYVVFSAIDQFSQMLYVSCGKPDAYEGLATRHCKSSQLMNKLTNELANYIMV